MCTMSLHHCVQTLDLHRIIIVGHTQDKFEGLSCNVPVAKSREHSSSCYAKER